LRSPKERHKMRQHICGNVKCKTAVTPLWRKGWVTPDGRSIMLCNACGLHYKKGHFCIYCNQIYRESDADDPVHPWIGCDRCSRWTHAKCEETNGYKITSGTPYLCPDCRSLRDSIGDSNLFETTFPNTKKRRRKPSSSPRSPKSNLKKTIISTFTFNQKISKPHKLAPEGILQPNLNLYDPNQQIEKALSPFIQLKFKTHRHYSGNTTIPQQQLFTQQPMKSSPIPRIIEPTPTFLNTPYREEYLQAASMIASSPNDNFEGFISDSSKEDFSEEDEEIVVTSVKKESVNDRGRLNISLKEVKNIFAREFPTVNALSKIGKLWAVCEIEKRNFE
jgi:hypothetical protein